MAAFFSPRYFATVIGDLAFQIRLSGSELARIKFWLTMSYLDGVGLDGRHKICFASPRQKEPISYERVAVGAARLPNHSPLLMQR